MIQLRHMHIRYLRYFVDQSNTTDAEVQHKFLAVQSDSVWSNDRGLSDGYFGKSWPGPAQFNFHNLQISALDALSAAGATAGDGGAGDLPDACGLHGIQVDAVCACYRRYAGVACEEETPWGDYYNGVNVSLTSTNMSRLICVQKNTNGTQFVTTCLSDNQMTSSLFTVQRSSNSQVRLVSMYGSYLSSAGKGQPIVVVAIDPADVDTTPSILFSPVVDATTSPAFEKLALRTNERGFVAVSAVNSLSVIDSDTAVDSFLYFANKAQKCS